MAGYYFDSSALVKKYLQESGSAWVITLFAIQEQHELYLAHVAGPELLAAFQRKIRTKEISRLKGIRAAKTFRSEWQTQFEIFELTSTIVERAMDLVEQHQLRSYDAVHLATAIEVNVWRLSVDMPAATFVSADLEQLRAADALGLATENLESYTSHGHIL